VVENGERSRRDGSGDGSFLRFWLWATFMRMTSISSALYGLNEEVSEDEKEGPVGDDEDERRGADTTLSASMGDMPFCSEERGTVCDEQTAEADADSRAACDTGNFRRGGRPPVLIAA
jgi:hypothetical protein